MEFINQLDLNCSAKPILSKSNSLKVSFLLVAHNLIIIKKIIYILKRHLKYNCWE